MRPLLLLVLALIGLVFVAPAEASILVRFQTALGDFDVELYDDLAPLTVANFLAYTRDGDYDDSIIHRSVPGFVVQGGARRVSGSMLPPIPQRPPVENEFQPCDEGCNVRGTIAMAKIDMMPDSATNSWFINLVDNSGYPDDPNGLDYANEGFTVFGRVLGDGMDVVDAVAALPRCGQFPGSCQIIASFPQLPLRNYAGGSVTVANLVVVNQVTELPEPGVTTLRAGALASLLLLARLTARRRGADPRP